MVARIALKPHRYRLLRVFYALVSGRYFHHEQIRDAHPAASNVNVQNGLLRACEQLAGATLASER